MTTDTIKIKRMLNTAVKKAVADSNQCGLTPDMVIKHTKALNQLEIILPRFQETLTNLGERVAVVEDDTLVLKTEKKTIIALVAGIAGFLFGGGSLITVAVVIIRHLMENTA